ncbi:MAG: hypothetical protein GXP26_01910 [Planctomycetes bacterium]|nr:hypothetical protein [Planctomycetota bacterium]
MRISTIDDTESLIRCGRVVGGWFLAIALLPPGGFLWQLGVLGTFGDWLVHGLLASMNLSGLIQ